MSSLGISDFEASADACAGWRVAMDTVVSAPRLVANRLICLCTEEQTNPVIGVAASKESLMVAWNDSTEWLSESPPLGNDGVVKRGKVDKAKE